MKKYFILSLSAIGLLSNAQEFGKVGVNTDNPQVTFQVQGNPNDSKTMDGVIIPKITGDQLHAKIYTEEQEGTMVYVIKKASPNNLEGQTLKVSEKGYYYFDAKLNQWVGLQKKVSDKQIFVSDMVSAKELVRMKQSKDGQTKDLGIEISTKIPPHSTVELVVDYSPPCGFHQNLKDVPLNKKDELYKGYYGVKFLRKEGDKEWAEKEQGSRKFTIIRGRDTAWSMATISAKYIEKYENKANEEIEISYKLQGYLEGLNETFKETEVRFNMFKSKTSSNSKNYNWGIGSMTLQGFIK
ncbi:hypothetical protein ACQ1Q5_09110 [Ornithobacterium rhinotracheale]